MANLQQIRSTIEKATADLSRLEGQVEAAQGNLERVEGEISSAGFTPAKVDEELAVLKSDIEAAVNDVLSEIDGIVREAEGDSGESSE